MNTMDITGRKDEGRATQMVERTTSRVPFAGYFAIAVGSIAVSAGLFFSNRKDLAIFVGHWAPTILVLAAHRKLVQIEHELRSTGSLRGL